MEPTPTIEALREAAGLVGRGPDADALRTIQRAQDALDAVKVAHLAALAESRAFESEGASSIGSWARLHLRIGEREAATLTRAAATLARLPQVAEAAAAGQMRSAHVNVFSYGLRHVGAAPIEQMMDVLLRVATTCEPGELMQVMRALREAVFPDELDDAWAKGMDKADLQVNPVPQGFSTAATPSMRWLLCQRVPAHARGRQVPHGGGLAVRTGRCRRHPHGCSAPGRCD
ncbi:DUF222 domain-containing protein [Aeromicrobium sp. CF3.5]|uniref:DUF222 domain-containing protein n=1 Tax=Aeromicrobium sp. CF3.5 TaxID=3373078 RepID=UPI003EE4856D